MRIRYSVMWVVVVMGMGSVVVKGRLFFEAGHYAAVNSCGDKPTSYPGSPAASYSTGEGTAAVPT